VTSSLAFAVRPNQQGDTEVVPVVDGIELTKRVHEFERAHHMEPAGSYGGLIPAFFRFGPAVVHYFASEGAFVDENRKIPLLGCECGEWGCWPLLARVVADEETVTWTDFEQPHRKQRDYSAFGPFTFDRRVYESAVADVADTWVSESS
jgi:hypothetical protein